MCGIFGALGTAAGLDVDAALEAMASRGPDQRKVLRLPGAQLGFVRLAILDLTENGAQPMERGDVTLVYNGEIYDHVELRGELESRGVVFRGRSDSEVLLEGYRAFGESILERIHGMFAFALWDRRERKLFAGRDRVGKKPLFYSTRPGGLCFASEIKALRAGGLVTTVNQEELPSLLTFGHAHYPHTMHAEVRELPPAHCMTWREGQDPVVRRYWRAPFGEPPLDLAHGTSEAQAVAEVRRLVDEAVKRRLVADVPVGAFLSGGVDSTIIVGLMAKHMPGRVRTFSIGFEGDAAFDETRFAREAAARFGTDHTEFVVAPGAAELVAPLVHAHDAPFGDSSALPTSIVSRLTRQHVTVALSGDGGDELFCGYTRFLAAEASERIPRALRRLAAAGAALVPQGKSERTLRAKARRFFLTANNPLAERLVSYQPYFGAILDLALEPGLGDLSSPVAWAREAIAPSARSSVLTRILTYNFETYLPGDLLVKADRSSMMHSLEVRAPFLDTALVEYAARLPDPLRRRGLTTKWVLKRAFSDLLPTAIVKRPKMGFGVPLSSWFRGPLRTLLEDHLGERGRLYRYVRRSVVRKLLEDQFAGRADNAHRLWLLLTLEIWLSTMGS